MDLRLKCKNKQYALCVIKVAKMKDACKFCELTQSGCKYNGDHRNTWRKDSEYCFDHVREWMSSKGFNDYCAKEGIER